MTRMRTHKKQFTTISNETIRNSNLSFEGIGFLAFCLSMPEEWIFNPKQLWKEGYVGRNKIYKLFNELIQAGKCIRIRKPNDKFPQLPGEISYEIFDDTDDCLKRAEDLFENSTDFVECSLEFKKFLRHPRMWKPMPQDPKLRDFIKEIDIKKKYDYKRKSSSSEDATREDSSTQPIDEACGRLDDEACGQLEKKEDFEEKENEPLVGDVVVKGTNGQEVRASLSDIFRYFVTKPFNTTDIKTAIERIKTTSGPINNVYRYLEVTCQQIVDSRALKEESEKSRKNSLNKTKNAKSSDNPPQPKKVIVPKKTITWAEYEAQLNEKERLKCTKNINSEKSTGMPI